MDKKVIVIGRTSAGKTTVITEMINLLNQDNISTWFFNSATNRPPRPGETNSEYTFVSDEEFMSMNFISTFMSIDKVLKYGILPDNNDREGVGFFSPISLKYATDTAKNMDNVQFVVIDLSREVRLERLKARGEDEEGIKRRFAIEDLEGEYDYNLFPQNTIVIKNPKLIPNEIAKIILEKIKEVDFEKIAVEIAGTSYTEAHVVEKYNLDITAEDLLDEMSNLNLEFCDGCGTWIDTCNMSEENPDICKVCNNENEDDDEY